MSLVSSLGHRQYVRGKVLDVVFQKWSEDHFMFRYKFQIDIYGGSELVRTWAQELASISSDIARSLQKAISHLRVVTLLRRGHFFALLLRLATSTDCKFVEGNNETTQDGKKHKDQRTYINS